MTSNHRQQDQSSRLVSAVKMSTPPWDALAETLRAASPMDYNDNLLSVSASLIFGNLLATSPQFPDGCCHHAGVFKFFTTRLLQFNAPLFCPLSRKFGNVLKCPGRQSLVAGLVSFLKVQGHMGTGCPSVSPLEPRSRVLTGLASL